MVTASQVWPHLVAAARREGAFVSSSIKGVFSPELPISGILACGKIREGEELIRIPGALHISRKNACKRGAKELLDRIDDIRGLPTQSPAMVAYLAKELQDVYLRLEDLKFDSNGIEGSKVDSFLQTASCYELCLAFQLEVDVSSMPHYVIIQSAESEMLLRPSPEAHYHSKWMKQAYQLGYDAVKQAIPPSLLEPDFSLDLFIKSHLILSTRAFGGSWGFAIVPVAEMVNHGGTNANARWREEGDALVISASRDMDVGEEVTITYGSTKSNARLLRSYGFTVHPKLEPMWSIRIWPEEAASIYDHFQIQIASWLELQVPSEGTHGQCLDSSLRNALNKLNVTCISEFLHDLCYHFQEKYHGDPSLRTAMNTLRSARARNPRSTEWWTYLNSKQEDGWLESTVRVKMGEYLCLTAHLEALRLAKGSSEESFCLEASLRLRECLLPWIPNSDRSTGYHRQK